MRISQRSLLQAARLLVLAVSLVSLASHSHAQLAAVAQQTIVVEGTLEAAPGYPRIHVQLQQQGQPLTAKASAFDALAALKNLNDISEIDKALDGQQAAVNSFPAFLDTGASSHVLSKATTGRFSIPRSPDSLYHEFGLHGETQMHVSMPYTLLLANSSGKLADEPAAFIKVADDVHFQISPKAPSNPLVEMAMGEINVVGMPAIRQFVVEIDPAPMMALGNLLSFGQGNNSNLDQAAAADILDNLDDVGVGPATTLHPQNYRAPQYDVAIPLALRNFSRRHNPQDQGPLPALADNPVIENIQTETAGKSFTGTWLLDTGAPASIISTKHAQALGLVDQQGNPTRSADFTLPLGGVGGDVKPVPGFRVAFMRVPTDDGRIIEYRNVSLLVTDVSAKLDTGEVVTLDGIFGTNFLFPTVAGLSMGMPSHFAPGPWSRIWIDTTRGKLMLKE